MLCFLVALVWSPGGSVLVSTGSPKPEDLALLEIRDLTKLKVAAASAHFEILQKDGIKYLVSEKTLTPNGEEFVKVLAHLDPQHPEVKLSALSDKDKAEFLDAVARTPGLATNYPQAGSPDFGMTLVPSLGIDFELNGKRGTVWVRPKNSPPPVRVSTPPKLAKDPRDPKAPMGTDWAEPITVSCAWYSSYQWQIDHSAIALEVVSDELKRRWKPLDDAAYNTLARLIANYRETFGNYRPGDRPTMDSMDPALKNSFLDSLSSQYGQFGFKSSDEARTAMLGASVNGIRPVVAGMFSFAEGSGPHTVITSVFNGSRP
jgi:hypothetical protein